MKHYVDREHLIETLILYGLQEDGIALINSVPIADVRENVHAHWYRYSYDEAVCTNCSYNRNTPFESTKEAKQAWGTLPKYCEACGAIMDEVIK